MNILFNEKSGLTIHGEWIGLEEIHPVLNGNIIKNHNISRLSQGENAFALRYTSPDIGDAIFTLEIVPEGQERCRIRCHIKNYDQEINSFGIYISKILNLKLFLRSGYTSEEGSSYEEPENLVKIPSLSTRIINSYSMTQLIPRFGSGCMVLGFDRHDRFLQVFSFEAGNIPVSIKIQAIWDQKEKEFNSSCATEWLEIFDHNEVENALQDWAKIVAEKSPQEPRIKDLPITGWSTKNNNYGNLTEENLLENLRSLQNAVQKYISPVKVFQIDDGFTPEMGDWLDVKPQFPSGIKSLLGEIKNAGFVPGLWIAPFMVGNRSNLFQDHPDWVLHDQKTGSPVVQLKFYGENRWFKRSEEYYILDGTHPDAFEYLRQVFRTWKRDWGCEYFRTDFMDFGCMYGAEDVVYYQPGKTRIEVWRNIAEMIRQEIGDSVWVSSRSPIFASVGLVDAMRVSGELGASWNHQSKVRIFLKDLANRNFTNHILFHIDTDCIPLRKNYQLFTNIELISLTIFLGMSGAVMSTSDDFSELDKSQIKLWNLITKPYSKKPRQPLFGKSSVIYDEVNNGAATGIEKEILSQDLDPVLVQIRDGLNTDGPHAVFLLNSGEYPVQRSIPIEELGLMGPLYIYEWDNFTSSNYTQWHLQVALAPHEGKLFFLSKNLLTELTLVLP